MSEPRCTDVEISVTAGGKIQIVKFNLQNDFGLSYSERYTIPADWSSERLEEWKASKVAAIQSKVDEYAQAEQDALLASSDWYGS